MTELACVESFCGAGGMAIGLKQAGFDIRLAFDLNEYAVETYKGSVGDECMVADASKLSVNAIKKKIGLKTGELALFAGGPPCQGFSKQRRGAHIFDDPRNQLINDYIRFVKGLKPKAFILENVAVFGQKRGKKYLDEFGKILSSYNLYPHFYNAADYGVAQTRERFVLVGISNDYSMPFVKPKPTVKKWKTVGETLKGLPEPPADYSVHKKYFNHQAARVTQINIERFSHVPQGGGWQDIPYDLRLDCHKNTDVKSGGWPDVYGRLEWDGQCPTITGGFDSFTRGRYGHPFGNRPLTPREAARIQGFPDYVDFKGARQQVRYQIGNAVPPPLARAIGSQIARVLESDELPYDDYENEELLQAALF